MQTLVSSPPQDHCGLQTPPSSPPPPVEGATPPQAAHPSARGPANHRRLPEAPPGAYRRAQQGTQAPPPGNRSRSLPRAAPTPRKHPCRTPRASRRLQHRPPPPRPVTPPRSVQNPPPAVGPPAVGTPTRDRPAATCIGGARALPPRRSRPRAQRRAPPPFPALIRQCRQDGQLGQPIARPPPRRGGANERRGGAEEAPPRGGAVAAGGGAMRHVMEAQCAGGH